MKKIFILASGEGTNAENIVRYFNDTKTANVIGLACNRSQGGVFKRMENLNVATFLFSKDQLENGFLSAKLIEIKPDLIILAGFLLKIPEDIVVQFKNQIINIHPALLPKYGGKGMYGKNVHQAVLDNNETETGITIHYVNENYDEGDFIFQKSVRLSDNETIESISNKIHLLEMEYFPRVIENILR